MQTVRQVQATFESLLDILELQSQIKSLQEGGAHPSSSIAADVTDLLKATSCQLLAMGTGRFCYVCMRCTCADPVQLLCRPCNNSAHPLHGLNVCFTSQRIWQHSLFRGACQHAVNIPAPLLIAPVQNTLLFLVISDACQLQGSALNRHLYEWLRRHCRFSSQREVHSFSSSATAPGGPTDAATPARPVEAGAAAMG